MNLPLLIINILLFLLYGAIALVAIDVIVIIGLCVSKLYATYYVYAGLKRSLLRHAERMTAPRPHEARDDDGGSYVRLWS